MTTRPKCFLVCPDGTHDPIELPHKTAVSIGRSASTRVTDTEVSRSQGEEGRGHNLVS